MSPAGMRGVVTNISNGQLLCSLSQGLHSRPWPASSHPERTKPDLCSPEAVAQQLEGAWEFYRPPPVKIKTTRGHFSCVKSEDGKRGWGRRGKNLQSSGNIPDFCLSVQVDACSHSRMHTPRSCPGWVGLRGQQLGLCPLGVTELQFEVAAMGLSSSISMLALVGCRLL